MQSGFNILLSNKSPVLLESSQLLDLYNEGTNTVLLERFQWGILEYIGASIPDSIIKYSKYALIANTIDNDQQFYLVDNNSPLSLAGQTELYGNFFLPKKGVERAYLANSPYTGTELVYGTTSQSETQMPPMSLDYQNKIKNIYTKENSNKDSLVNGFILSYGDSIAHSFVKKTIVINSNDGILIPAMSLTGNIKIISQKEIFISSGAQLDGIILIAPYIEIEQEFEGNCQIFATDSLKIGDNVQMDYLSAITIFQKTESKMPNAKIKIGENFVFSGVLIGFQELYDYKNPIQVLFSINSDFKGSLYCNGDVQLKGKFIGNLIINRLKLEKPGSTYINHLEEASINKDLLSKNYALIGVSESEFTSKKVISWLE